MPPGPSQRRAVVVEADGGSRGNPGAAAYGSVLFDADTGEVIAERAEKIGVATNNVAEYRGLISGLELVRDLAPGAAVEVRMDSKLVIEQMAGRWKVKHPAMRPLALEAQRLVPRGVTWTWIPRERNKHADRILNEVLDGNRESGAVVLGGSEPAPRRRASRATTPCAPTAPPAPHTDRGRALGWRLPGLAETTVVLVRHGTTEHTGHQRFSGGLGTADPSLDAEGLAQARAVAGWLAPLADDVTFLVASPMHRTLQTAQVLAERLGRDTHAVPTRDGLAETDFGGWEGRAFAEVHEAEPDAVAAWQASPEIPAGGDRPGESLRDVERRVVAALEELLEHHGASADGATEPDAPGEPSSRTLVVVSHVTPIKILVARALGAPLASVHAMELAPASVSVVAFYSDGRAALRLFNATAPLADSTGPAGTASTPVPPDHLF